MRRPHLEYCINAVGPYMMQDLDALEKAQRRATRLIIGFKGLPYEERLRRLNLTSLSERFKRSDLIETYKVLTKKLNINSAHFLEGNERGRTRGHRFKLSVRRAKHQIRAKVFSNRVVGIWNQLPDAVVSAASTNQFKNLLDKYQILKLCLSLPAGSNPLRTLLAA